MTLARIHRCTWIAAGLAAAFVLELSGAFRIGAAGASASFIIILLAGFFEVKWFAGSLALFLVVLSLFLAPFWVLEIGGVALLTLSLLIASRFLTGNRVADFLILLSLGTLLVTVGGGLTRGGTSLRAILFSLLLSVAGGMGAFFFVRRNIAKGHAFTL